MKSKTLRNEEMIESENKKNIKGEKNMKKFIITTLLIASTILTGCASKQKVSNGENEKTVNNVAVHVHDWHPMYSTDGHYTIQAKYDTSDSDNGEVKVVGYEKVWVNEYIVTGYECSTCGEIK